MYIFSNFSPMPLNFKLLPTIHAGTSEPIFRPISLSFVKVIF